MLGNYGLEIRRRERVRFEEDVCLQEVSRKLKLVMISIKNFLPLLSVSSK